MSKYPFVIVSNRLPISVAQHGDELVYETSSGGLATAMSSLNEPGTVWVGWCGMPADDLTAKQKQQIREEFARNGAVPVFLTKAQVNLFYEGYCNDTVWPLFHYFQSATRYVDEYWTAYEQVNELFAAAVRQAAQANARIWVQDYQLMLLPALIRTVLPKSTIGFFLHIPFPSFEIYRLLPERTRLLEGIMGADVVGFHIYDYARHFMSSCRRLIGVDAPEMSIEYDGRIVHVGIYPIGVDYKKFVQTARSAESKTIERRLKRRYKNQRIILSVDRLDYSKGIPQRLEAYQLFLQNHPEYQGKVVLQMIAVPSRTDVPSYQELRDKVEQSVSRINGIFGTADWMPISYQFQNRPFAEIVASYASADVMLVTPIRDGMNLVAKEYVASKQHTSGVLVLSELAGAIDDLTEVVAVNPNNPHEIATAIATALEMPVREQKRRLAIMQKRLAEYDIQTWARSFIDDMSLAAAGGNKPVNITLNAEQRTRLVSEYKAAKRRLIILDYDGTIKPFTSSHSVAAGRPPLHLTLLLARLTQRRSTQLAVVSGRPAKALTTWFRGLRIDLAAEHGARVRRRGKWKQLPNTLSPARADVLRILQRYTDSTPGSEIEEKDYALTWHYRNVLPEQAYNRAVKLRQELLQTIDPAIASVHMGNKVVEVKQKNVNKGVVVDELISEYKPDFILCIGDDYTDEDMFQAVGDQGYTFKVGSGETAATYRVNGVEDVIALLEKLAGQTQFVKRLKRPLIAPWRRK